MIMFALACGACGFFSVLAVAGIIADRRSARADKARLAWRVAKITSAPITLPAWPW